LIGAVTQPIEPMIPSILYHYTSLRAFESIIATGKLRATHFRHLHGDPREIDLGVDILVDALKHFTVTDELCDYRQFLIEGVEQFRHENLQIYVVGFTPLQDSKHHWETYAADVAIGFCGDRVGKGFPIDITRRIGGHVVPDPVRPDPANRFIECRYIDRVDLQQLIEEQLFAPNSYPAMFGKPFVGRIFMATLSVTIYRILSSLKHGDFHEDVEFRCVNINPDPDDYPVRDDHGQPYIEMQFEPSEFVKEVWIGPRSSVKDCEFVIDSLRTAGRLRCDVRISTSATR
jgi:hypothetical protein